MEYRKIDLEQYARKQQFEYFCELTYPYVGLTVNVDITEWLYRLREQKRPFFLSFLYAVTRAANEIPEFRQRIVDGDIIEFERCKSSYTVALDNHAYCYCTVDCNKEYEQFLSYARAEQEKAKQRASLDDEEESVSLLFISTITAVTYTAIVQPVPQPADSNPRITWCRYFEQDGRWLIPVTLLCNHALIDGFHMEQFYQKLKEHLEQIE